MTGCIFETSDTSSDGVYVFTYTLSEKLRPDTVVPQSFSVSYGKQEAEITDVLYYPDRNRVKLYLNGELYMKKLNVKQTGVKGLDGEFVNLSMSGYAFIENETSYGGVNVTGVYYYQNGAQIPEIKGRSNILIKVPVANGSNEDICNADIYLTDPSTGVSAHNTFSVPSYSSTEVEFYIENYIFGSNDINFAVSR
ncbi:MAG: hypothetical protein J6N52_08720 [Clostridia bacterium]|nr:hypothetical protein [Clostridia bacterium]